MEPIKLLLTQHSDILVVLMPHVRDILCGHAVYPQNATETDFGPLPSVCRKKFRNSNIS